MEVPIISETVVSGMDCAGLFKASSEPCADALSTKVLRVEVDECSGLERL